MVLSEVTTAAGPNGRAATTGPSSTALTALVGLFIVLDARDGDRRATLAGPALDTARGLREDLDQQDREC